MTSQPTNSDVERLLDKLDGSGSDEEWSAVVKLRSLLGDSMPDRLLALYHQQTKAAARSSYVYHSVRYARKNDAAVTLALLAVRDKSKVVRYRACMLLACSQRKALLSTLRELLPNVAADTKADLLAAIDAIESQKQDYFVDRDHSGLTTLTVC